MENTGRDGVNMDVIPLDHFRARRGKLHRSRRRSGCASGVDTSDRLRDEAGCRVISANFENAQLQLMRFRTRQLEEARFVVYKGMVLAGVPCASGVTETKVRVLVKRRLIEYYYYCPDCGTRATGTIDCRDSRGVDCLELSWTEVEQAVRNDLLSKAKACASRTCAKSEG